MILNQNNKAPSFGKNDVQPVTYLSMDEYNAVVANDPLYMATAEILCRIGRWVIKEA